MVTISDTLTYIDGSLVNGRLVVSWKPFTVGNVNVAGGELEWQIVDGVVLVSVYSNTAAVPYGSYYVAKYELENGAVYVEQWQVPDLVTVNLGQVRVSFPPSPSLMISPLQLSSLNAQPGMFLMWDGTRWVPGYPSTFNMTPNSILLSAGKAGVDVNVAGSPVALGNSATINVPDAGPAARGAVTTAAQSFAGVKTFLATVTISSSLQFVSVGRAPNYGELLAQGSGAGTSLYFGGNIRAYRVANNDRTTVVADRLVGGVVDLSTAGGPPSAVMPGNWANPAVGTAAIQLATASGIGWSGLGTDTLGSIWLRTGQASPSQVGFLYLDTSGNVTCREFRMDPYQHPTNVGVEASRSDATMVVQSSAGSWLGFGCNIAPEIWFRAGADAAGAYYYFGPGGARFGNLTVGNIIVTGGVTFPPGTAMIDPTTTLGDLIVRGPSITTRLGVGGDGQVLTADSTAPLGLIWVTPAETGVPLTRQILTGLGLTGGGNLSNDLTLSVVPDTTVQRIRYTYAGTLVGIRPEINLVPGANVAITVVDDTANNRINVTVGASGGPSGMPDPTTTLGDLIVRGPAAPVRIGVGADTQVLTSDSTAPLGVKWAAAAVVGSFVPTSRRVIAGAGMTGGGALTADVTLNANVTSVFGRTGDVVLTPVEIAATQTPWRQDINAAGFRLLGTGLVGIGTASPQAPLSVRGQAAQWMLLDNPDTNYTNTGSFLKISLGAASGNTTGLIQQVNAGGGSGGVLALNANGGNVGIGTATAAYKLDVAGDCNLSAGSVYRIGGVPISTGGGAQTPWAQDIQGAGFKLFNTGYVGIVADSVGGGGAAQLSVGGRTDPRKALWISFDTTSNIGRIEAGVSGVSWNNLLINATGGNVAVGGDNPLSKLSVIQAWNPTTVTGANQLAIGEVSNNPTYRLMLGYYQDTDNYKGAIQVIAGSAAAGRLLLQPQGGFAGIGLTAPACTLDISTPGSAAVQLIQLWRAPRAFAAQQDGLMVGSTGGTPGTHDYGAIVMRTDPATGDGGAAIFDLHVGGTSTSRSTGSRFLTAAGGGGGGSASTVQLITGGTARFSVNNDGSATMLTGPLMINQKTFGGASALYLRGLNQSANWPGLAFSLQNTNGVDVSVASIYSQLTNNAAGAETGDMVFATSGEHLRITAGGNVGINNSNPSASLHVFGNVAIQTSDPTTFGCSLVVTNSNASANVAAGMVRIVASNATDTNAMIVGIGSPNSVFEVYASGRARFSGSVTAGSILRATNSAVPVGGGAGVEIHYTPQTTSGAIIAYNRDTATALPLKLGADGGANSTVISPNGNLTVGGTTLASSYVSANTGMASYGQILVCSGVVDAYFANAAVQVRESQQAAGPSSGDNRYRPRIAFHWSGVVASQIGMNNDGTICAIDNPGTGYAPFQCAQLSSSNLYAPTWNGYYAPGQPAGTPNSVVSFDGTGYLWAGWINTVSGDNGTAPMDRVYASSDGFIRYYTLANFKYQLGVSGPTTQNVATGVAGLGGIYRNNTSKTMWVTVTLNCGPNTGGMAYTDSAATPNTLVASCTAPSTGGCVHTMTFVVIPGNYYRVVSNPGTPGLQSWIEWY